MTFHIYSTLIFSPQLMMKLTQMARGHFVLLSDVCMHRIPNISQQLTTLLPWCSHQHFFYSTLHVFTSIWIVPLGKTLTLTP